MPPNSLNQIVPVLQVAIGPVILISGVGLLLLTMTNRLGPRHRPRPATEGRTAETHRAGPRARMLAQVAIIYRRARVIRLSITLAALSALLAALIIVLFVSVSPHSEQAMLVSIIFIACMASLFASLVAFIRDMANLAARAQARTGNVKPDAG